MDPELLRQREAFKKRAARQPTVQTRPNNDLETAGPAPKKSRPSGSSGGSKRSKAPSNSALVGNVDLKVTASSSANFGTLVKIVDHLKKRHLERVGGGLHLDEILEEIIVFDIDNRTKKWLLEALPSNRRIQMDPEGRFEYKPPFNIKGKNGLIKNLRKLDMEGAGGILMSDLADCILNPEKTIADLGDAVIAIPTQVNKRKDKVVFFRDPDTAVNIDREFKERWRSVGVDHLDEKRIEEYLQKHGIESMKDLAPKKGGAPKRKTVRRNKPTIVHNEHLSDLLETYNNE